MRDVEAGLLHRREHRFRRWRRGGEELHHMRQRLLFVGRRIEQGRHHDRRAAQMRHLVIGNRVIHGCAAHRAQADMGAGHHRDRPRKAPAVAMEHRQRPKIDRMLGHAAGHHIAERQQVRAAVVIDHALGIAGGAGGIVERDGVPFVVRHQPGEIGIALRNEILVFDVAQPLAVTGIFRIVVVDYQRLHFAEAERLLHHLGIFAVGDHHLGLGMIEGEGDDRRIEPRVERVEHALRHRHAVVGLQHRRRVGEQHRH